MLVPHVPIELFVMSLRVWVQFMPEVFQTLQWLAAAHVRRMDCRSALKVAKRVAEVEEVIYPMFWPTKSGTVSLRKFLSRPHILI